MRKAIVLITATLFFTSCRESAKPDTGNSGNQPFTASIESLKNYQCPEWFRDAKFGIYMHWGVYSVAEMGEWYARKLYMEETPEYAHHVKTYGHPSEFGYKDFIPLWKAEHFDPDNLVALFKEAGAKYFAPCAVHHDNFDLWDSKYQRFNAVNMGPKKDLIGMWKEATLKAGLKFGVTTHLSRSISWMNVSKGSDSSGPLKGIPYDGVDPEYSGLYHDIPFGDTHRRAPFNAPKEWRDLWALRIKDLIDNYQPDHLYFDCALPFRGDDMGKTGMDVIAHYYNNSIERYGELNSVMCIKERPWQGLYAEGMTTLDYERGKAPDIRKDPWQTDDSMGPWGYRKGADYMSADATIDKLIDIVSKNGNMLLNVPIRADGTLDQKTIQILKEIGEWLSINGEAIYGTRPWYRFGEGETNEIPKHVIESPYTWKDIRYTTKGDTLYGIILDWPGAGTDVILEHLAPGNNMISEIKDVSLVGYDSDLEWEQFGDGLKVILPENKPHDFAYALRILFSDAL